MWPTAPGASGALRLLGAQSSVLRTVCCRRVTFSACKTGLCLRKRDGSGLGLDLDGAPGPSSAFRVCGLGISQKFQTAYYMLDFTGPNVLNPVAGEDDNHNSQKSFNYATSAPKVYFYALCKEKDKKINGMPSWGIERELLKQHVQTNYPDPHAFYCGDKWM
ncbi:hypothetical protein C8J57DRAFT_1244104 [Mycena rebaudengoi]|nr:hypothetical protein C8J57DRAFT_1244104 [Mycena rebaudengoi]